MKAKTKCSLGIKNYKVTSFELFDCIWRYKFKRVRGKEVSPYCTKLEKYIIEYPQADNEIHCPFHFNDDECTCKEYTPYGVNKNGIIGGHKRK